MVLLLVCERGRPEPGRFMVTMDYCEREAQTDDM